MIYYTADPHLGHENIIRLCGRPYADVNEMNRSIIANWQAVVKPDDDVYILGDLMYKCAEPEKILRQLTGHLHLIRGNHDGYLDDEELRSCFDSIDQILEVNDEWRRVILCHYPLAEWDGAFRGAIHLYGHIHNMDSNTKRIMDSIPNCYNAGMDCVGFAPMTLTAIIDFYKAIRGET